MDILVLSMIVPILVALFIYLAYFYGANRNVHVTDIVFKPGDILIFKHKHDNGASEYTSIGMIYVDILNNPYLLEVHQGPDDTEYIYMNNLEASLIGYNGAIYHMKLNKSLDSYRLEIFDNIIPPNKGKLYKYKLKFTDKIMVPYGCGNKTVSMPRDGYISTCLAELNLFGYYHDNVYQIDGYNYDNVCGILL